VSRRRRDAGAARAEDLPDSSSRSIASRRAPRGANTARIAEVESEVGAARAKLAAPEVRAGLGEEAAKRLEDLLVAAREAGLGDGRRASPSEGSAAERARVASLPADEATGAFDDELAAAGLGYFVDGDVITDLRTGHRLVIIYSFTVESVSLFASGGATVRALDLRRLDHLNFSQTLLGFTRPTCARRWCCSIRSTSSS